MHAFIGQKKLILLHGEERGEKMLFSKSNSRRLYGLTNVGLSVSVFVAAIVIHPVLGDWWKVKEKGERRK